MDGIRLLDFQKRAKVLSFQGHLTPSLPPRALSSLKLTLKPTLNPRNASPVMAFTRWFSHYQRWFSCMSRCPVSRGVTSTAGTFSHLIINLPPFFFFFKFPTLLSVSSLVQPSLCICQVHLIHPGSPNSNRLELAGPSHVAMNLMKRSLLFSLNSRNKIWWEQNHIYFLERAPSCLALLNADRT